MNLEALEVKINTICSSLVEIKQDLKDLKECKHCTNAPSFKEKFKTHLLLIMTLGCLTGGFFLIFLNHVSGIK